MTPHLEGEGGGMIYLVWVFKTFSWHLKPCEEVFYTIELLDRLFFFFSYLFIYYIVITVLIGEGVRMRGEN